MKILLQVAQSLYIEKKVGYLFFLNSTMDTYKLLAFPHAIIVINCIKCAFMPAMFQVQL